MESIYNLVPYESVAQEKKPMYRSSGGMKASVPGSTFGKLFTPVIAEIGRLTL
jgi:hypothetical protein